MTGMDSLILTVSQLANIQPKSILGKDILLLPPGYELSPGVPPSDEWCAAVEWAPCDETEQASLTASQHVKHKNCIKN